LINERGRSIPDNHSPARRLSCRGSSCHILNHEECKSSSSGDLRRCSAFPVSQHD
jgi:hypothetical protein